MPLPLVIGHRGASALAPENTIAAFKRALLDGADGLEFDVRLAADGVPVVIHDADLRRTGRLAKRVTELTSEELGTIDVGTWFNRKHPGAAGAEYCRETVPTLQAVFEQLRGTPALLYVELKCAPSEAREMAARVAAIVEEHSLVNRVVVESFDLSAIREIKVVNSSIRTAALFEPGLSRPLLSTRRIISLTGENKADEIALHHSLVTPRRIRIAAEEGLHTVVWTVDRPRWFERAARLGIRAIITNNPATMVHQRQLLLLD
jgi:glycerophosphoryl diester phosphodiesterase